MITAKVKKAAPAAPADSAAAKPSNGTIHNSSISESDSSMMKANLDPETRRMLQSVVRIKKELMKQMKDFKSESPDDAIVSVLRGYVGQCGETAQIFIDRQEYQIAEKILRSCEQMLKKKLPPDLVAKTGLLYQVNNNLANLSNRTGDVEASVNYLLAALDCTNDPRLLSKDDLPIAETLLNLANANIYLGKYELGHKYAEQAYQFAANTGDQYEGMLRGCERKRATLGDDHPDVVQMEAHQQNLVEQYQGQINLKILAKLATGQAFEKMQKFDSAIREFRIGTQLVERNFGTQHQMYTVLANAMGGARLKTKFQTKEVLQKVQKVKTPPKKKSPPKEDPKHQPKMVLKRQRPGSARVPTRRNRTKVATQINLVDYHRKASALFGEVRKSSKPGQKDNLFYTNCDSWTKVHCHKPRAASRSSSCRSLRSSLSNASHRSFKFPSIKARGASMTKHQRRVSAYKDKHATSTKKKDKRKKKQPSKGKEEASSHRLEHHRESLNIEIKGSTPNDHELTTHTKVKESNNCETCSCHSGQSHGYIESLKMMRQVQEDHMRTIQMVLQNKQRHQELPMHCYMPQPWAHPYYMPYPWGMFPHPAQNQYTDASSSSDSQQSFRRSRMSPHKQAQTSRTPSDTSRSCSTDKEDLNDRESLMKSRSYRVDKKESIRDSALRSGEKAVAKQSSLKSPKKSPSKKLSTPRIVKKEVSIQNIKQDLKDTLTSSDLSEKSFRAPVVPLKLTKLSAIVIIQKWWRVMAAKIAMKFYARKNSSKKEVLFQTMYKGINNMTSIVNCKVTSKGGFAKTLHFSVKTGSSSEQFDISLEGHGKVGMFELREKVMKILETAERTGDVCDDIRGAFNSFAAWQCLQSEVFSPTSFQHTKPLSDDEEPNHDPNRYLTIEEVGQGFIEAIPSEQQEPSSKITDHRKEQMLAEFRAIKQQVSSKPFVLNLVEVLNHDLRFVKPTESEEDEASVISAIDEQADKDEVLEPMVIEKIQVNSKANRRKRSDSAESAHSYKVFLGRVLWSDEHIEIDQRVFSCRLIKEDFLKYKLVAYGPLNNLQKDVQFLPFEEYEARDMARNFLVLEHEKGKIMKVGLRAYNKHQTHEFLAQQIGSPQDSAVNEVSMVSRQSPNISMRSRQTFDCEENVTKAVLYMFNFLLFDVEYHAEITRQYSNKQKLNCYVLQCDNLANKLNIEIDVFSTKTTKQEFINKYVVDNLRVYWKKPQQPKPKQMAYLAINFSKLLLKGAQMSKCKEFDEPEKTFQVKRNGAQYEVGVTVVANKGVYIKCQNASRTDQCLCIISKDSLDEKLDVYQVVQNQLEIITENGYMAELRLSGFYTDFEADIQEEDDSLFHEIDEIKSPTGPSASSWKVIYGVSIEQAEAKLNAQLCCSNNGDSPQFKVQLVHCKQNEVFAQVHLSVSQCKSLIEAAQETGFAAGTLIDVKAFEVSFFKGGLLETQAISRRICEEKNTWMEILKHAFFLQASREIMFGFPKINFKPPAEDDINYEDSDGDFEFLREKRPSKPIDGHLRTLREKNAEVLRILDPHYENERNKVPSTKLVLEPLKSRDDNKETKLQNLKNNLEPRLKINGVFLKKGEAQEFPDEFVQKTPCQLMQTTPQPPQTQPDEIISLLDSCDGDDKQLPNNIKEALKAQKAMKEQFNFEKAREIEEVKEIIKGEIKCTDIPNFWISFRIRCDDPKADAFSLMVWPKVGRTKEPLFSQALQREYIRAVIGDSSSNYETIEMLQKLKRDIQPRLRNNGALLQSRDDKIQAIFKISGGKNQKASDNNQKEGGSMESARDSISSQSSSAELLSCSGKVSCDDNLTVSYSIRYDRSKAYLTAAVVNGQTLCNRQQLSAIYYKKVVGDSDENDIIRLTMLQIDLEKRLEVLGRHYAKTTKRQLPDEFFSRAIPNQIQV